MGRAGGMVKGKGPTRPWPPPEETPNSQDPKAKRPNDRPDTQSITPLPGADQNESVSGLT